MTGLLNLNKPAGITSRDVVNRVQRLCPKRTKLGHAGTLDPLATGVLLVCVGAATRLVPCVHQLPKTYRGTFLLGRRSDTDDVDGTVELLQQAPTITAEQLRQVLPEFCGTIAQVPPQVSAVKVRGERAYRAARRGEPVHITPRPVTIHRLELLSFAYPHFALEIECSSGTYVRAIGRDLAARLGTAAVMSALIRTAIGPFTLQNALDPDLLTPETLPAQLQPLTAAVPHLPQIEVSDADAVRLRQGQSLTHAFAAQKRYGDEIAVVVGKQLVCIAIIQGDRLQPNVVFPATGEPHC